VNINPNRSVQTPIKSTAVGARQDTVRKTGTTEGQRQVIRERRRVPERRIHNSKSKLPYDMRQTGDRRRSGRFIATT
jgi:hypothetical protein